MSAYHLWWWLQEHVSSRINSWDMEQIRWTQNRANWDGRWRHFRLKATPNRLEARRLWTRRRPLLNHCVMSRNRRSREGEKALRCEDTITMLMMMMTKMAASICWSAYDVPGTKLSIPGRFFSFNPHDEFVRKVHSLPSFSLFILFLGKLFFCGDAACYHILSEHRIEEWGKGRENKARYVCLSSFSIKFRNIRKLSPQLQSKEVVEVGEEYMQGDSRTYMHIQYSEVSDRKEELQKT